MERGESVPTMCVDISSYKKANMKPYEKSDDNKIREIAEGIISGKYFTSGHVQNPQMIASVFMVAALMDEDDAQWLTDNDITFFYEEISKAAPRSANGYPCFFSMKMLDRSDHKKLNKMYQQLKQAMDSVKG
jgi:hypothetical protein